MSSEQAHDANRGDVAKIEVETVDVAPQDGDSDPFEVDAIQRRVAARKIAREIERKKKEAEDELKRHLMERALRAKNRPAPVQKPSLWSRARSGCSKALAATLAVLKSKTFHNAMAYSTLTVMVCAVGVYAYQYNAERTTAAFREKCAENNMKYAVGSRMYCYDAGRFARKLTESGVTDRLGFDWDINQRLLRLAIRTSEREVSPVAQPVVFTPVAKPGSLPVAASAASRAAAQARPIPLIVSSPNGPAAGTIGELAAQLARREDIALK